MSDNEQTQAEQSKSCPVCEGEMASTETICQHCREELTNTVMAVRAVDYPPPARVVQTAEQAADIPSSAPLEAQLDAAVDDDLDLLPLAPIGDFVRSTGVATEPAAATVAVADRKIAATIQAPSRPAPVSTPVEMDIPAKALQAENRWKIALVAVLITIAAGVLAALIWSLVVPAQPEPEAAASALTPAAAVP